MAEWEKTENPAESPQVIYSTLLPPLELLYYSAAAALKLFGLRTPLHYEKLLQTQRALVYICRLCLLIFLSISVYCIRNLNWGIIFFQPYCAACGILVPWPEIKPVSPVFKAWVLTTGPPEKSLNWENFLNL